MGKVVAFIPVRGGSKSIPLKNIKLFCGKPLVYWTILALQKAEKIDSIVVATDSDEIEKVVSSFEFSKVFIYRRLDENANDSATTESVMLEYLSKVSGVLKDNIFILVQATSPLTTSVDIDEALSIYEKDEYDSMLSCTRSYRFFWNANGTSKNYDYLNRPRRQDFDGDLMENGAFYISTVGAILHNKNRLSGRIGFYVMPEYTGYEIDELDDWVIMENLMRQYILCNQAFSSKVKAFISDVDGVMTDGGMYFSEKGDELKKFNTKDGVAFRLLQEAGVKTGIITSENTQIVSNRAKKIKVDYLYQGEYGEGKLSAVLDICEKEGISLSEVAYIGDDINCVEVLKSVGVKACPSDASLCVKDIPGIIQLQTKGGDGVVREFFENVLKDML